jgi:hypothetical protein
MYGYLHCNSSGAMCFRVKIPNHEPLAAPDLYDWCSSVHVIVIEALLPDQQVPRGKVMRTTTYQYLNLYHDLVNGRAMYGIIHFVNQTPVISFRKK